LYRYFIFAYDAVDHIFVLFLLLDLKLEPLHLVYQIHSLLDGSYFSDGESNHIEYLLDLYLVGLIILNLCNEASPLAFRITVIAYHLFFYIFETSLFGPKGAPGN
jgi:hypothetical protein